MTTASQQLAELQAALKEKEQEIKAQTADLHTMVSEKREIGFIKIEFKRAVELITAKYQLLFALVEQQKSEMSEGEYQERLNALRSEYTQDVSMLAVAIDDALGVDASPASTA